MGFRFFQHRVGTGSAGSRAGVSPAAESRAGRGLHRVAVGLGVLGLALLGGCLRPEPGGQPVKISILPQGHLGPSDPARPLVYNRKFNLALAAPGRGWSLVPPGETGDPDALDLSFRNPEAGLEATLQAFPVAEEGAWQDQRQDWLRAYGREAAAEQPPDRTVSAGGLIWSVYEVRDRQAAPRRLGFAYRLGVAYQVEIWATARGTPAWSAELDEAILTAGALINPTNFRYTAVAGTGLLHDSPAFGYRLRGDWEAGAVETALGEILAGSSPLVDYTFLSSEGFAILVLPFHLGSLQPSLDALTAAAAGLFHNPAAPVTLAKVRPWKGDGLAGRDFDLEPAAGAGPWRVCRLVTAAPYAYLLVGLIPGDYPADLRDRARRVFDGFETRPVPAPFQEGPPLDALTRREMGSFLAWLGVHYGDRGDWRRGAEYFAAALEAEPSALGLRVRLVDMLLGAERWQEALARIEEMGPTFGSEPATVARAAFCHHRLGDPGRAVELYELAVQLGLADEELLADFGYARIEAGQPERAARELASAAEALDSPVLRLAQAAAWRASGRSSEARRLLTDLYEREGLEEAAHALLELHLEEGETTPALVLARRLVAESGDARAYHAEGLCLYQQEDFEGALRAFQRCRELDPGHREAATLIELCQAALGRGDQADFREPIPPVELPTFLRERLPEAVDPAYADGYGALSAYLGTAVRFRPGEPLRQTFYQRATARDLAGTLALKEIVQPFTPLYERIYLNHLTVWDAAGREVGRADREGQYVTEDTEGGLVTSRRLLHIPIAGLTAGGGFEVAITREVTRAAPQIDYLAFEPSGWEPRQLYFVWLEGDGREVESHQNFGMRREEHSGGLLWSVEQPPIYQYVPFMPAEEKVFPRLRLGPARPDWPDLARDYQARLAPFLTPDAESRAEASRLTAGLGDPLEKVAALAGHLQRDYTYRGVLFGVRAQIPHAAPEIRAARAGDCKDHTVLLVQWLRAAGLEAHPALVNTAEGFTPRPPSLDQFDHMIVYVPALRPQPFLDPTDKQLAPGLVPRGLAGQTALILDPARPRLEPIGGYEPAQNRVEVERAISLEPDGAAVVREQVTLFGYQAAQARDYLAESDPRDRAQVVREWLPGRAAGLRVREVVLENLDNRRLPLGLRLEYEVRRAFVSLDGHSVGRLPASWDLAAFLGEREQQPRRVPVRLYYPVQVESRIRFQAPAGRSWSAEPRAPDLAPFGTCRLERGPADGALELRFWLEMPAATHPASSYDDLWGKLEQAADALECPVLLPR